MLFSSDNITRLLPQRHPILMVSTLEAADMQSASTTLTVPQDNMFVTDDHFTEPGIVEHIAQSAAAWAGYLAYQDDKPAPLGFIGEVKKCHINSLPQVPCTLHTDIQVVGTAAGVSLITASTTLDNGEPVCTTQMKIFVQQ